MRGELSELPQEADNRTLLQTISPELAGLRRLCSQLLRCARQHPWSAGSKHGLALTTRAEARLLALLGHALGMSKLLNQRGARARRRDSDDYTCG